MLTLYAKIGCPYCAAVIHKLEALGIPYNFKNANQIMIAKELIELGGKYMVPFLVDTSRGVKMYESADINEYLETYYSGNKKQHES